MVIPFRSLSVLAFAFAVGCSQSSTDGPHAQHEWSASSGPAGAAASGAMKSEEARTLTGATLATQESVYDESADGVQQITDALAIAKEKNQRVLLQFGANWCGWCRKLHTLFQNDKDIANKLSADYVVVMIDVNGDHNKVVNGQYGQPTHFGLPAIVILDAQGNQLTTKDTDELEEGDHHSPEKVMAFLQEWSPRT